MGAKYTKIVVNDTNYNLTHVPCHGTCMLTDTCTHAREAMFQASL